VYPPLKGFNLSLCSDVRFGSVKKSLNNDLEHLLSSCNTLIKKGQTIMVCPFKNAESALLF